MRLVLLLAVVPLWAADDANTILRRFIDAQKQNDEKAKNYTYVEEAVWFTRDKAGPLHQNRSETNEIVFIEGSKYRKLVARNGKPIGAKDRAKVDQDMRITAEERLRHTPPPTGGRISSGHGNADLGTNEELLTLFDNRMTGEEQIGGRKAWVIESAPQTAHTPTNQHEKDALNFTKTLWIDKADFVMLRAVYTVTGDQIFAKPGSAISIELEKINQEVWQPSLLALDIRRSKISSAEAPRTEYHYSKFQRFDVQSTITIDK
jgi:hypothetical protein